ncbi:hypothetical protein CDL15_Pgr023643 [Punica granatum]|uniref:Uncharacterized protein n=1 Tax=Punica granatum TaxID=22663 RepID=A0A218W875_PUNGR|nr:hypothetical protein CDL15_Pgr023643 [Punica granatum]
MNNRQTSNEQPPRKQKSHWQDQGIPSKQSLQRRDQLPARVTNNQSNSRVGFWQIRRTTTLGVKRASSKAKPGRLLADQTHNRPRGKAGLKQKHNHLGDNASHADHYTIPTKPQPNAKRPSSAPRAIP